MHSWGCDLKKGVCAKKNEDLLVWGFELCSLQVIFFVLGFLFVYLVCVHGEAGSVAVFKKLR